MWHSLNLVPTNKPIIYLIEVIIILLAVSCKPGKDDQDVEKKQWLEEDRRFLVEHLQRTRDEVLKEIGKLNAEQWNFRETPYRWSIAEIVEHQQFQDELFYRELNVLTDFEEMIAYLDQVTEPDDSILNYASITGQNIATAPWYLQPYGRWCSQEESIEAFLRVRNKMIEFIENTDKNLRLYVTSSGRGNAPMRDLHQLMLVSIAHTDRHLKQLRRVKGHPEFPGLTLK